MNKKIKILLFIVLIAVASSVMFITISAASDGNMQLYIRVNGGVKLVFNNLNSNATWNDLVTICQVSANENPIVVGRNSVQLIDGRVVLLLDQLENGDYSGRYFVVNSNDGYYVNPSSKIANQNNYTEGLYDSVAVSSCTSHNFKSEILIAPLCLLEGTEKLTCLNDGCGFSYTRVLPELGHKVENSSVTAEPTCTEPGVSHGICSYCGSDIESSIPTLSHDYDWLGNCKLCGENYFFPTNNDNEKLENSISDVFSDIEKSVNDFFENDNVSDVVDTTVATAASISGIVILYYLIQLVTPFVLKFIDLITNKKSKK